MEVNGKKTEIAAYYFNSIPIAMVLEGVADGKEVIMKYLEIYTEVLYYDKENENIGIEGKVLGSNSIQTDKDILEVPYGSKIKVVVDDFIGKTIPFEENSSLDILYDALDWQLYTGIINADGFASTDKDDIKVGEDGNHMNITLKAQKGVIDGIAFNMNLDNTSIYIPQADELNRIDLVLLEKNQDLRTLKIIHKQGEPSGDPKPPSIEQQSGALYELPIFEVRISKNQTILANGDITDKRNLISKHLIKKNSADIATNRADIATNRANITTNRADIATIKTNIVRTGEIVAWAGEANTIPTGALLCDGRTISRTTYVNLFNKIGSIWGVGDGGTTFNIPDGLNGVLKGAGGPSDKYIKSENRGKVGSYQDTAIINITGYFGANGYRLFGSNIGGAFYGEGNIGDSGFKTGNPESFYQVIFDPSRVVNTGTTNCDNNLAVHWIIFT